MSGIFHLFFYNPLYNGLVSLIAFLPHKDVGLAVILFTLLIRLLLFPLSKSALITQMKLRTLQPEMDRIKEKYKSNKEEQARATMAFYKDNNINPFSSFFMMLLQIPIIISLYLIFLNSGLPTINQDLLYSFVPHITLADMSFLGLDISQKIFLFAVLAGITQFLQAHFSIIPVKKTEKQSFQNDLARSMNVQMKYVLPVFIFFISLSVSGAVALYWITGNTFTIGQELYMRKQKLK